MNFINQYIKKEESFYVYSEQFKEGDDNFILAVGQTGKLGLITKTNLDGGVIWERAYTLDQGDEAIIFNKIIQISNHLTGDENQTGYILYVSTKNNKHYLLSVDSENSDFGWANEFFPETKEGRVFLEPSFKDYAFFLAVSDGPKASNEYQPFIAKYAYDCTLLEFFRLSQKAEQFVFSAAESHDEGIVIGANNLKSSTPMILNFDEDLNLDVTITINDPTSELFDIKVYNKGYLITAKNLKTKLLYFSHIKSGISANRYDLPGTESHIQSSLCLYKDDFYVLQYKGENGVIHRFNSSFDCLWTKDIAVSTANANGIHFINQFDTLLTFVGYDEGIGHFLANTNQDLDSCATLNLETIVPKQQKCFLKKPTIGQKESNIEVIPVRREVSDVNSEINQLCVPAEGESIKISDITSLQSPNFVLQTAGSTAADGSAKGIHLRWFLKGALGAKHLPKGDYAQTNYNFNKPKDYVRIYRTPYQRITQTLNFQTPPTVADDTNRLWVYNMNNKLIYVRFLNATKYNNVRSTINPLASPLNFMTAYGDEAIEVESKKDLFFAAQLGVMNVISSSSLRTETLAVTENLLTAPKFTNSRKTYSGPSALADLRLICENGRSVRYQSASCTVAKIDFEFYGDFMELANKGRSWEDLGDYALNLNDSIVYSQLEPVNGLVHNKWPRFNDNAFVNVNNYKDKWNGPIVAVNDRNIKIVVSKFIELSNDQNNPTAIESVFLGAEGEQPETEDDFMDISLLDVLNIGANDYHVARMLGLGMLDTESLVFNGEFIYASEYFTYGDLEDGLGAREVQHLSLSLPTSINDQRLPLPITIGEILPGIVNEPDTESTSSLTNPDGYTFDGRYRYVTLLAEPEDEDLPNLPFYNDPAEFNRKDTTFPVYGGVEYRKNNETQWVKPELSNDPGYQNAVPAGQTPHNETIPLIVSEDTGVLYIHKQRDSGTHYYGSYGINIFSRATASPQILPIVTDLKPANLLKPPVNINAHLVRAENPLLLTSQEDQNRYALLAAAADKTLVRLTYDYNTQHELSTYKVEDMYSNLSDAQLESNTPTNEVYPNDREVYAEEIELYFRKTVPKNVSGKAVSLSDDPSNPLITIITTTSYNLSSTGEVLVPNLSSSVYQNYIGGMFIMGNQQFVIYDIAPSATNPIIKVFKKEISDTLITSETPTPDADELQSPVMTPDGLFLVVENMQNTSVWGSYNPHSLKAKVGASSWSVKREVFHKTNSEGIDERYIEKSRGFWQNAVIVEQDEAVDEDGSGGLIYGFRGLYKVTFSGFTLPQHEQYNANGVSVEWYNGIIRLKRQSAAAQNGERSTFQVVRTENTGSGFTVYFQDPDFELNEVYDEVSIGTQLINYYPGYKLYLYADASETLTEANILPAQDEGVRYSIFGLRAHDLGYNYFSRISTPVLMFAQELIEPMQPELPIGADYATRPDFFGKATYTFTTKFGQKPNSVLYYRSNDEALLNALYEKSTVEAIRAALLPLGGNDEVYLRNRWDNFFNFAELAADNSYKLYPPADVSLGGYRLPVPDRQLFRAAINNFISWHNEEYNENVPQISSITSLNQIVIPVASVADSALTVLNFVEQTLYNAFVPLTELPIVYQHIKPNSLYPQDYNPIPKKQNIKDRNGYVLSPTDPEFDMAPMVKIMSTNPHTTLFTDFTLDGTSKNIYFYGVKEMTNQMKMGDFSPFLGPIKLVNSNPPEAPEIKRIMPILKNEELGIPPSIQFEINAYQKEQYIRKITLYRAFNMQDAQSIRTMTKVIEIDLEEQGMLEDPIWLFTDTFAGLTNIPYGDSLLYRITVSRKVEYHEEGTGVIIEYAPSQPSKIAATLIVESSIPDSPVLQYVSQPVDSQGLLHNVKFDWNKTVYNGKYHLYKMNAQGNWAEIKEEISNNDPIYLSLADTNFGSDALPTLNADGERIYHHFKVIAENSAGMFSTQDNVLTI